MRVLVLKKLNAPLELTDWPKPVALADEILIRVLTCGICRTDLHIIDGELGNPYLPLILGHQIVGIVEELGKNVKNFKVGDRVGVPWLGGSCQECFYCKSGRENLCDSPTFTGYHKNGGYAEYVTARAEYCFLLPNNYSDLHIAPLLCAGLIGYRAYKMVGDARDIGFYGFGTAAHILAQVAIAEGRNIYAFTRAGDEEAQNFAKGFGVVWAGGSDEIAKDRLDAAIIFASAGELIPLALRNLRKGGIVVSAEIHMSDIPGFPYNILWNERVIRSVANLTRGDGREFLEKAGKMQIETNVIEFPLEQGNEAIRYVRSKGSGGSAVLRISY